MASDNKNNDFEKPNVDEEYLMNVISGDEPVAPPTINKKQDNDYQQAYHNYYFHNVGFLKQAFVLFVELFCNHIFKYFKMD